VPDNARYATLRELFGPVWSFYLDDNAMGLVDSEGGVEYVHFAISRGQPGRRIPVGKLEDLFGDEWPDYLKPGTNYRWRGPFAVDLRRLSPADATTIRDVSHQRIANLYCDTRPLDAFDVVVHLPHINLADPDVNAVALAPNDVQQALRHTKPDP
jgi:hypothetical protein